LVFDTSWFRLEALMFRNLRTHYQANTNYKGLPPRCKPDELAAPSRTSLRASREAPRIGAKLRVRMRLC